MPAPVRPPYSVRAACRFGWRDRLVYDGLGALARLTGWWRYPTRANGDLEAMGTLDKAYWFHKSGHPIERAVRRSGLEELFARQPPIALPTGFVAEGSLRLSAVGDLMNHVYVPGSGETLYREVAPLIFDADVAMANLEGVVQTLCPDLDIADLTSGPRLGFAPDAFTVLTTGSRPYDFLATASNHSLDGSAAGVATTLAALRERGIAQHGMNERESDAERATILERRGFRLGVVAHTFGLNGYHPPPDRPRIVNRTRLDRRPGAIDFTTFEAQLAHCREAAVDVVIAQLHWGMEFERYPRPEQREVAHHLAELGVDLIIGHHPHVLQPVEHYRTRRDPDRVVPIFYSLGNLTNPFDIAFMATSGVARVELARGPTRNGPRTYVRSARVHEVVQVPDHARRTLHLRPVGAPPVDTR